MAIHSQSGYRARRTGHCVVISTCAAPEPAERLAHGLVEARLAACVQLTPITSLYRWQGRVAREPETRLLIKTRWEQLDALNEYLHAHHDYDVPEVIALAVEDGSAAYLGWIDGCLGQDPAPPAAG